MNAPPAVAWWRYDPARGKLTLTLHVQPNARRSAVAGRHGDALKIRIAAPALDDKANRALIDFLHQLFKLPLSQISIRQGNRGRRKIIEIAGCGPNTIDRVVRLESL